MATRTPRPWVNQRSTLPTVLPWSLQRFYPVIPMQIRIVMNRCVVEGYELPAGSRVFIVQSAAHYSEDAFPHPFSFDPDRYLPERGEDAGPSYAPFGLGTHMCPGHRWVGTAGGRQPADADALLQVRNG